MFEGCTSADINFMHYFKKQISFKSNGNMGISEISPGKFIGQADGNFTISGSVQIEGSVPQKKLIMILSRDDKNYIEDYSEINIDEKGKFYISGIPKGAYAVLVYCEGYEPTSLGAEVNDNKKSAELIINLKK